MDITGKIIVALEPRSGVSQRNGNSWKMQSFVLETQEQYPKHMVFEVFGEDRLRDFDIKVGDVYTVSFDIDAHEYQGRWFNNIRAWRVVRGDAAPTAQPVAESVVATPAAPATSPVPSGEVDDLPF